MLEKVKRITAPVLKESQFQSILNELFGLEIMALANTKIQKQVKLAAQNTYLSLITSSALDTAAITIPQTCDCCAKPIICGGANNVSD